MTQLHVVRPREGKFEQFRVLAEGAQTSGHYCLLESETPPGEPARSHSHEHWREAEYVVSGEREIVVDGEAWRGGPGLFVLAPQRGRHTMRTVSAESSTWLHFFSPAGIEEYMRERQRLRAASATPDALVELAIRYGSLTTPTRPADDSGFAAIADGDGTIVTGANTGNDYELTVRTSLDAGTHLHDGEEGFYVLAGELLIQTDGQEAVLPPRSFALVPRGVTHEHAVRDGRVLVVRSPGAAGSR